MITVISGVRSGMSRLPMGGPLAMLDESPARRPACRRWSASRPEDQGEFMPAKREPSALMRMILVA
jgi:hypothetical protein